jgi:hypothetical protein
MDHGQEFSQDERLHADQRCAFFDQLEAQLAPILKADGFRSSRKIFRRIRGEVIHIIQPQRSLRGQSFAEFGLANVGTARALTPLFGAILGKRPHPESDI